MQDIVGRIRQIHLDLGAKFPSLLFNVGALGRSMKSTGPGSGSESPQRLHFEGWSRLHVAGKMH